MLTPRSARRRGEWAEGLRVRRARPDGAAVRGTPGAGCQPGSRHAATESPAAKQALLTSTAASAQFCLRSALRCVPVQGSGIAEQLCACTPGRSVPRSARVSQQQSVLPRRFQPGPPWRYPGREGAVPDTSRPAQGAEGWHGPDPRPAPLCPASPARHGGEPHAAAEGLQGRAGQDRKSVV